MKPFAFVTPQSAASAVALVRDDGRFIAGGVDLLGEMKDDVIAPPLLVSVKALPGGRDIVPGAQRWSFGAAVTLTALAEHAELRRIFPAMAQAAEAVGSPQIRNVGTLGGNLAQHSRCWYYRHRDVPCYKKGGARCYARGGEDKYHSLFAKSRCLSPCVSNLAVALAALDARIIVQRGAGAVSLTVAQLYERAWENGRVHHSLRPDDLILRVEVSVVEARRSVYLQVGERSAFDWALVSCAATGHVAAGRWTGVRLALGCVAPMPWQRDAVSAFLEGREVSQQTAEQAAALLLEGAEPRGQAGYKIALGAALVRRALAQVAGETAPL